MRRHRQPPDGPVHLSGRDYHLGRGPVRSACAIGELHTVESHTAEGGWWLVPQSPNLCWPEDRAWFVATEIDFDSTLVAGTRDLVDDLLAHDVLEALEVPPRRRPDRRRRHGQLRPAAKPGLRSERPREPSARVLRPGRSSYRGAPAVAAPRLLDAAPAIHPRAKVPSSRPAPPIQPGL